MIRSQGLDRLQRFCSRTSLCCVDMRSACAGVVDVAGGRGSLSFALRVQHGVTCTVIDPRPPKPTKEHLRFLQRSSGSDACPIDLSGQPRQGRGRADGRGDLPEHIQAAFDEDFWSGAHAQRLHAASLVVGLHPDQASTRAATCMMLHRVKMRAGLLSW